MRTRPALLLALLGLILAACGDAAGETATAGQPGDGGAAGDLRVVATTSIVGDIAANVVGDAGTVEVVLPRGTDPHDFSPSASQIAMLTEADLVVANGLGLEEGLTAAMEAAEADGARVFELASAYDSLREPGGHDEAAHEEADHDEAGHEEADHEEADHDEAGHDEHAAEGGDPHIWHDPVQMADAVVALGDELSAVAGDGQWAERAQAYRDELLAVDAEVAETLEVVPPENRKLVTNHDTFGYFADRYGFEVIGAAIPSASSTAQSSAAQIAELAELIAAEDVPAIFSDNVGSDDLVRNLAQEVDREVAVVPLLTDSLAPEGEEGDTYLSMLAVNAERIAEALGE